MPHPALGLPLVAAVVAALVSTPVATASSTDAPPSAPDVLPPSARVQLLERTPDHVRTRLALKPTRADALTGSLTLEDGVTVVGVRWEADGDGVDDAAATPSVRTRTPGGTWSDWEPMAAVETGEDVATEGTLVVGAAEVQVRLAGDAPAATLETWTSYPTPQDAEQAVSLPTDGPLVVGTRHDWGADESLRGTDPESLIAETPKLGVTIHHTAGSNSYTRDEVPAVLRSIYGYHAQTLGWGDIGYGLLVDRFGQAWEGRAGGIEKNIQLAHALGMNRDWHGISVIGDYDAVAVPEATLSTVAELTAMTLEVHGADAQGEVEYANRTLGWTRRMPVVHGHQDVMATLCPGMHLYDLLPQIRTLAADLQAQGLTATQRVGGEHRYAVAAHLAQEAFLSGTGTAYLASGESLPDALGVGPVAAAADDAVLLTKHDVVPQATLDALARLDVQEVVLVGGELAVGEAVVEQLTGLGYAVRRVSGPDRYSTAATLATQGQESGGTVYLAEGQLLTDALGGAAAAAEADGTMLLTRPDGLPRVTAEALRTLSPARVVVLGQEGAVSEAVTQQLETVLPGVAVERVGGADRYATSALVAGDAFESADSAVVASGTAPADALAGTQLAARHDGPVLLSKQACRPRSVAAAYDALGITVSRLAGGSTVLDWTAGSTTC
ncbi:cell wall-binding repeat-containing protein [Ornithinimicrobium tianjinense]|uniref:Peptidoglycan recognition protein family domain-containing protein n=1 Tax=Ornithinimicrobium tianjinense TaxID=1195761 RepID=A0A917BQ98_9MICO|nr:cell wall-binding repeat-containing protein [Ornithinimicrobium tianjinense]GGF53172.1 hypothetical protein GCM10011366_21190 [Ornithinimicrobium tianjinense]